MKSQRIRLRDFSITLPFVVVLGIAMHLALPYINSLPALIAETTGLIFFYHAYSKFGIFVYYFVLFLMLNAGLFLALKLYEKAFNKQIFKTKEERAKLKEKYQTEIEYVEVRLSWPTKALIFVVVVPIVLFICFGIANGKTL